MASGMDDNRILAEIERLLAREDPGLEARMSELARQFPGDPADPASPPSPPSARPAGDGGERDRRRVLALAAVVIAVVGLVLTAILTRPSGPDAGTRPGSPAGLPAAPVART
ncbi:DUF3040 domain-containing protein [Streptomyces somaliensis]|uniref:DUF3040 domain-containing protein n=1 Tax=Streptomyces somaliensis TaxID=78355 RepID=UPI0020CBD78F|nr:DUF3040 domain-containing protein [Streptomyces somaliensis]MCP9946998.1 DUF3040 domain-containing protein [Streptomyces somaliensis]MCP9963635.1 DUF3040 domain-containing protein [Streptomyces somaliensis]MCP9972851.1 DUF3040 domain-containing protein [Streptomyces somaliensis]MCP9976041.1 DUF3040 domain-containing protein [Streptomyces somaliensis]